jgi:heme exporter protein C
MASDMLLGMLLMVGAFWAYAIAASLHRLRSIILEREKSTEWVQRLVGGGR